MNARFRVAAARLTGISIAVRTDGSKDSRLREQVSEMSGSAKRKKLGDWRRRIQRPGADDLTRSKNLEVVPA